MLFMGWCDALTSIWLRPSGAQVLSSFHWGPLCFLSSAGYSTAEMCLPNRFFTYQIRQMISRICENLDKLKAKLALNIKSFCLVIFVHIGLPIYFNISQKCLSNLIVKGSELLLWIWEQGLKEYVGSSTLKSFFYLS